MTKTQKMLLGGLAGVVLLVFLAINVAASQFAYAPLMFRIMAMQDVEAAREFLANVVGTGLSVKEGAHSYDVYEMQSTYLNSHFDNIFAREVGIEQLNSDKAIAYYESLLALNTENPQVLMKLGLLYGEKDDEVSKARGAEYVKKAKEVDPWVGGE